LHGHHCTATCFLDCCCVEPTYVVPYLHTNNVVSNCRTCGADLYKDNTSGTGNLPKIVWIGGCLGLLSSDRYTTWHALWHML
jgi:hypothetical protein